MLQIQSQHDRTNLNKLWDLSGRCWRWCCKVALVQPSVASYFEPVIRLLRPGYRAGLIQARLLSVRQQADYLQLQLKPAAGFNGFVPGQHLLFSVELDGVLMSRTFSISSSLQQFLTEGTLQLTLKIQPHAGLTRALATRAGDPLDCYISQAEGDFIYQPQQAAIMLAAGSGITPIHAMLSSFSRLTQPVVLFYSYRGADNLLFADSWLRLKQQFPLLQIELWDSSQNPRLSTEQVTSVLQRLRLQALEPAFYLCGPASFNRQWQQLATELGVATLYQESFGTEFATETQNGENGESLDNQNQAVAVTVLQHGRAVQLQSRGNLLQSLEQAGLSPRYGCRRGICKQCLCDKTSGQVQNLLTGEVSSSGAERVQLCISVALSPLELQLDNTA
jgi:stearoyl-CoA 9-desaturase NADPH oxidoreductase